MRRCAACRRSLSRGRRSSVVVGVGKSEVGSLGQVYGRDNVEVVGHLDGRLQGGGVACRNIGVTRAVIVDAWYSRICSRDVFGDTGVSSRKAALVLSLALNWRRVQDLEFG